jgi:tRNA-binding protein
MDEIYISWQDFEKVEIKTGTIIRAEDFPEAHKPAYILTIDFGPDGIKKSSAQITKLYAKEELEGKQIIAVTNFPPKQIGPVMSECLVLGIDYGDGRVSLLSPDHEVENGSDIS